MKQRTSLYLDHAAATPVDEHVLAAMLPYFSQQFYNPSAAYGAAQQTHQAIDAARVRVAHHFGARPAEVVFTAGGTEANNLAIHGVMRAQLPAVPAARILVSAVEHDSVLEPAGQYSHSVIPVDRQGLINVAMLRDMIDDDTVMVSVMYANNEVGAVQPIREIGRLLHDVRNDRRQRAVRIPLYFHSDAAQAANYLDLQAHRLGVDLLTINGGKLYGPKQSGALYVRAGLALWPLIFGGGQERAIRSGTENVPAIIGLAAALDMAQAMRPAEAKRLVELQQYFFAALAEKLPTAVVNGSLQRRLPNNLHVTFPGSDNERLLYRLDALGVMAAAGSACSASSDTPSHVLRAMGLSDEAAASSLRFTMGRSTTRADIDRLLACLVDIAA